VASTSALRFGWLVRPEKGAMAASTTRAPARAASRALASPAAEVSWVWKWIGRPTSPRSAFTSAAAA